MTLFFINVVFLTLSYSRLPEPNTNFLGFILTLLCVILIIFFRNYERQIVILSHTGLIITPKTLKQLGPNEKCSEVELSDLREIKVDTLFGFTRFILLFENSKKFTFFNILESEDFLRDLSLASGVEIKRTKRNHIKLISKLIMIYLPSAVTIILTGYEESRVTIDVFYLILNLNSIFFVYNLSERKFEGGISNRSSGRIMAILILFLFYQIFQVF